VTSSLVWGVVALVLIAVIALAFGYYIIQRMRHRRATLALEVDTAREMVEDRSFNQLKLARAEADVLARQGINVSRPSSLLDDAEAARSRGDYDTALALARSAHETLLKLKDAVPLTGGLPPAATRPPSASAPVSGPAAPPALSSPAVPLGAMGDAANDPGSSPTPPPSKLPKNKAEAQFQLHLLQDELAKESDTKGPNSAVVDSTKLREQAQAAFDRADFTEALRFALKARRRLGSKLETLPPSPGTLAAGPSPVPDPDELLKCGSCGETLRPSDRFCRYCGTLRGPERCPACGAASEAGDQFCSACGGPLGAA